jgi:hypothetical protein
VTDLQMALSLDLSPPVAPVVLEWPPLLPPEPAAARDVWRSPQVLQACRLAAKYNRLGHPRLVLGGAVIWHLHQWLNTPATLNPAALASIEEQLDEVARRNPGAFLLPVMAPEPFIDDDPDVCHQCAEEGKPGVLAVGYSPDCWKACPGHLDEGRRW